MQQRRKFILSDFRFVHLKFDCRHKPIVSICRRRWRITQRVLGITHTHDSLRKDKERPALLVFRKELNTQQDGVDFSLMNREGTEPEDLPLKALIF